MRRYCYLSVVILLGLAYGARTEEAKSDSADESATAKQKDADCNDCLMQRGARGVGMPCSCLQELAIDWPGPIDLYLCHAHWTDSCEDPYEVDVWCGSSPSHPLPQVCNDANGSGECESIFFYRSERGAFPEFPGHGCELDADSGWNMVNSGMKAAKEKSPTLVIATAPEYHVIPKDNVPKSLGATGDIVVIAADFTPHLAGSPSDGKKYYLCLELKSAKGVKKMSPIKEITESKHFFGRKFRIKYKVEGDDEPRTGLVWVK
jgi:hypothetical protein